MGISIGKSALVAALSATALATGAESAGDVHEKNEATVLIAGVPSGTYREETVRHGSHIEDTVEQLFVFNRVGSRVEMSEKDVYDQDANGQILGGHSEMSSSKTTVAMDYTVHGNTVVLTTHSGGRNYTTEIPVTGPLFGPAGMRRMLLQANVTSPDSRYQTFVPSLGGASQVELKYLGAEPSDGVSTRKFSQTIAGAPGAATLWVDAGGYTAQTLM